VIEQVFVPAVVLLSTLLAFGVASRRFGWPARAIVTASGKVLECVGATVLFCLLNGLLGVLLILAARGVSGRFVSLYLGADHTLIALSALQALLFQWWRESSRRG
jgi:hypothetical protein